MLAELAQQQLQPPQPQPDELPHAEEDGEEYGEGQIANSTRLPLHSLAFGPWITGGRVCPLAKWVALLRAQHPERPAPRATGRRQGAAAAPSQVGCGNG